MSDVCQMSEIKWCKKEIFFGLLQFGHFDSKCGSGSDTAAHWTDYKSNVSRVVYVVQYAIFPDVSTKYVVACKLPCTIKLFVAWKSWKRSR